MAIGDDYAILADLKQLIGITDADDDDLLNDALAAASRGVTKFCRRQFNKVTVASPRKFYPALPRKVRVDDFHTSTDLVVKIDQDDDGTFGTTLDAADYQLEPLGGVVDGEDGWPFSTIRIVDGTLFPRGHRPAVEVTAQWGWDSVPAPVKRATLAVAEELFKLKDAPFGVAGFGDMGSIRVRENPKVAMMLAPYRRHAVLVA